MKYIAFVNRWMQENVNDFISSVKFVSADEAEDFLSTHENWVEVVPAQPSLLICKQQVDFFMVKQYGWDAVAYLFVCTVKNGKVSLLP